MNELSKNAQKVEALTVALHGLEMAMERGGIRPEQMLAAMEERARLAAALRACDRTSGFNDILRNLPAGLPLGTVGSLMDDEMTEAMYAMTERLVPGSTAYVRESVALRAAEDAEEAARAARRAHDPGLVEY